MERKVSVTGVASDQNCAKITLMGIPNDVSVLCAVFSALAAEGVNVDMIVQAGTDREVTDLTFTVTREEERAALGGIISGLAGSESWEIACDENVAKVSIVGGRA